MNSLSDVVDAKNGITGTSLHRKMRGRGERLATIKSVTICGVVAVSLVLAAGTALAQKPSGGGGTGTGGGSGASTGTRQTGGATPASNGSPSLLDTIDSPFPDTGKQKRNDERQRRLVSDTQRLLALTAKLKDEVAASGAEAMTPAMLKEMDEIEKLAKSVKEKMRD